MFERFPFYKQLDQMDCGPTCLRMIARHYGKSYSLQYLRDHCYLDKEGVSIRGISEGAEHVGMRSLAIKIVYEGNSSEDEMGLLDVNFPCIAHWKQKHFIVVYKATKKHVWVADPAIGKIKMSRKDFTKGWISDGDKGVLLLLETTPDFYKTDGEVINKTGFGFLLKYLRPYRSLIIQLFLGLLLGSLLQLIFPFLTQSIVDVGIENRNIGFIYLILAAQLMLFVSQTSVSFIQSWILLHIGTRINVALISDFLIKLMKLPIAFFETKMIGDLLQRIGDHNRIETFLTTSTLTIIFSFFNLIVFGIVLLIYNVTIFLIFLVASILYMLWVVIFLKKRRKVDHQRFEQLADNQSSLIELIQGMQEIKLQRSEKKRRWQWTHIQAKLFRANIRSLAITQYQDAGAGFINQLKDILISFVAAKAVIEGQMTLGMMMAVQYIVGQLNAPLQQFIVFVRAAQDAKISLERLGEIHTKEEEVISEDQVDIISDKGDIKIENLNFQYNKLSDYVLKDLNLSIPKGKITAIVGTSGSGKTTLVKLLLGFFQVTQGSIKVSGTNISNIKQSLWRKKCSAVMQDGFIFSDSIANNIGESDETVDKAKLLHAVKMANIQEFIESLPLAYNTKIGSQGNNLSQGQKQRLLIARAVYNNPDFLFFDEATNALDANNERVIMENMNQFFKGRTVVVVAHRLSTVKNADQIIVLEKGELLEQGTHEELVANKAAYYNLVKNQLELGT